MIKLIIAGLFLTLNSFMWTTSMPQALWLDLMGIVSYQELQANYIDPATQQATQAPVLAWSDPHDYQEALYVHAPDGACGVSLDRENLIVKISLCEI